MPSNDDVPDEIWDELGIYPVELTSATHGFQLYTLWGYWHDLPDESGLPLHWDREVLLVSAVSRMTSLLGSIQRLYTRASLDWPSLGRRLGGIVVSDCTTIEIEPAIVEPASIDMTAVNMLLDIGQVAWNLDRIQVLSRFPGMARMEQHVWGEVADLTIEDQAAGLADYNILVQALHSSSVIMDRV